MTRHFLRLYLLVLLPLLALIASPVSPLTPIINPWIEALAAEQYRGTYYLLERELAALPQVEWPQRVEQIAAQFGRDLRLARLDAAELDAATRQALTTRGFVYVRGDELYAYAWRRLGDSDYALRTAFGESPAERNHREAAGTAYLIRRFAAVYDDPQQAVRELAPHFGFPLALAHESDLHLSAAQTALLDAGKVAGGSAGLQPEIYYGRLGRGDWVLVAGPLDDQNLDQRVLAAFAMMPTLLVALAVFLWLRPVWRDLKRLNATAAGFGDGDLTRRAALPKGSTLQLLAATFNRMAESIQRLIEGQKELVHAVSHEFKTPVARLRFALEMLRDHGGEADRSRYLESMASDLDELEALIAELLTHARYDRPDLDLHREAVELPAWLERLLDGHRRGHPAVRLELRAAGAAGGVMLDPAAMEKLFNNLLANAIRHANAVVLVTARRVDAAVEVCVEDDGPGVPEAEREAIFDPFYRLDGSRERGAGGSGLGLAIARRVAERHGGTIACTDAALGGACFCVRWPAAN